MWGSHRAIYRDLSCREAFIVSCTCITSIVCTYVAILYLRDLLCSDMLPFSAIPGLQGLSLT